MRCCILLEGGTGRRVRPRILPCFLVVAAVLLHQVSSTDAFATIASPAIRIRSNPCRTASLYLTSSQSTSETEKKIKGTTHHHPFNPVPLVECEEILVTLEQASRSAGTIILKNLGCSSENASGSENNDRTCARATAEIKTNIKDVVSKYDKQAQQVIEEIIKARYPNFYFLGEENVAAGAKASGEALTAALQRNEQTTDSRIESDSSIVTTTDPGFTIIVDPIDGTANFASGLPLCAVTMTVVFRDIPIVGIVYDPHRNEFFSSIRGQGTRLKAEDGGMTELHVQSSIAEAKDAIVNAGCPADPQAFATSMKGMLGLNSRVRGVRVVACSALTLAWIASGRLTAHFGYDLSSWDLVAGALMIQEAGGHITDIDGSPYKLETRNMLCSNGKVHDEILTILKESGATTFSRSES